jgi:integrase
LRETKKQQHTSQFQRLPVDPEVKAMSEVLRSWLTKNGYAVGLLYPENLCALSRWGADLNDPESVKDIIAKRPAKQGTKLKYAYAYDALMRMKKQTWDFPDYKQEEIIPFVPDESELDQIISACYSRRMATYLQTLKETWPDPTEGLRIERKDLNGNVLSINHPVKDHLPRAIEISDKLVAMLNALPRDSHLFFPMIYGNMFTTFNRLRKRLAAVTKNERFLQITPTSFRTWGGTMLAHYSNGNVLFVKKMLGHKRIENTMKYIGMIQFKEKEPFETAVSTTIEEDRQLMANRFTFVTERRGVKLWQRPKRFSMSDNKRDCLIRNAY